MSAGFLYAELVRSVPSIRRAAATRPGIARLPDRQNRVRVLPGAVPFREAYQGFFKQK
jgi:hypothetical protein